MGIKVLTIMVMVVVVVVIGNEMERGVEAITICNMSEDGMNACKPAVTKPNPTPPSPDCCQALSEADLKCLCSYRNSMWLPSLGIDPDLALSLPAQCNLSPPPNC